MAGVTSFMREDGKSDVHDPEPTMFEQDTVTPDYAAGFCVQSLGEVIFLTPWTDVPSYVPVQGVDRRIAARLILTRNTARQLYRDLGKLLNAGN